MNLPRSLALLASTSLCLACAAPGAALRAAPTPQAGDAAGTDAADLAKKLSNPIAALISVPFQLNYDEDIGPGDAGDRLLLNFQPVVPISLNETWNVISRTIVPLVALDDVPPGNDESGLGDVVQSVFFSPKEPTASGLIWGAGPVVLLPTASDDTLGGGKLGLGPTAVVLKQLGPWTIGGLTNHIWSVAGEGDRADVSATFVQPFASYTTPAAWTYTLNSEATYDWKHSDWAVPVNAVVSKLTRFGTLPVSLGLGARYWVEPSDGGPEGLGLRFALTFLFPK